MESTAGIFPLGEIPKTPNFSLFLPKKNGEGEDPEEFPGFWEDPKSSGSDFWGGKGLFGVDLGIFEVLFWDFGVDFGIVGVLFGILALTLGLYWGFFGGSFWVSGICLGFLGFIWGFGDLFGVCVGGFLCILGFFGCYLGILGFI